uniref:6-phosphogluconolactonase n=1 Tax=Alexandrium monilatum TaxID=311494 RepID=A0A7S4W705_9DINO
MPACLPATEEGDDLGPTGRRDSGARHEGVLEAHGPDALERGEAPAPHDAQGSGPRHLAEHPSLDFVYSVQEMGQSVAAWRKHANGSLELAQILSLVPEGSSSKGSKAGEIVIAPDGRALYATNRGRLNTVTVFSVVEGSIAQVQQIDAPRFPRGMELAHGGTLLLVASQEDTTVESFRVAADGTLSPTGHVLKEGLPDHPATLAKFGPVAAPLAMET